MGSPLSSTMADLVIEKFESGILQMENNNNVKYQSISYMKDLTICHTFRTFFTTQKTKQIETFKQN